MKNTLLSFLLLCFAFLFNPALGSQCTAFQTPAQAAASFNSATGGTVTRAQTYTFCLQAQTSTTALQLSYSPAGSVNNGSVIVNAREVNAMGAVVTGGSMATATAQGQTAFGIQNNRFYQLDITISPVATATSFVFGIREGNGNNITTSEFMANIPLLPLPVEFSSFTATSNGKHVLLNWSTASETDNQGFEIERSQDGNDWSTLSFVGSAIEGATGANYSFQDRQPLPGRYLYRLRQLDYDGTFALSDLVSVKVGNSDDRAIYPNPTAGQLWIPALQAEEGTLRIFDLRGALLREQAITPGAPVDVSALKPGTYLLSLITGEETTTQRFVKR